MVEDMARLREAWLDFAFSVLSTLGFVRFARGRGMALKPWAAERAERDAKK